MTDNVFKYIVTGVVAIALIVSLVAITTTKSNDLSLEDNEENLKTISTNGQAQEEVEPDMFTLEVGVEARNESADVAEQEVTRKMNDIISSLKDMGVTDDEIKTHDFRLSQTTPSYYYTENVRDQFFVARQSLTIEREAVDSAGEVISTALNAGANEVQRLNFGLTDEKEEEIQNRLIKRAVADAERRARTAVEAAGGTLGDPTNINLDTTGYTPYRNYAYATDSVGAGAERETPDIQPGSVDQSFSVSVEYQIQ